MAEPSVDVIFVGRTGVGKSSLINTIRGIPDNTDGAATVSRDAPACTVETVSYETPLEGNMRCLLWDTRGHDEAVDTHDRGWITKLTDCVKAYQQARELKETLRDRTRQAKPPILMWCIEATKVNVPSHWQHFYTVYVDYCKKKAIPVVVITQTPRNADGLETGCRDQLRKLKLNQGEESHGMEVRLQRVRKYNPLSPGNDRSEDSKALKRLISELGTLVN